MSRRWIPQQFGELPEKINEERLWELTTKLRAHAATIEEKEEIIKGHLRLMIAILGTVVSNYSLKYSTIEDLIGSASLALVEAVNDAEIRLEDNDITPYIVTSIRLKIKNEITKLSLMRMPVRTLRWKLANGINNLKNEDILDPTNHPNIPLENLQELNKLPTVLRETLMNQAVTLQPIVFKQIIKETIFNNLNLPSQKGTVEEDVPRYYDVHMVLEDCHIIPLARYDEPSSELMEILWLSAESPMQKAIMQLRMEGHTYSEIGRLCGYSTVRVGEIVRDIEERFNYYWGTK